MKTIYAVVDLETTGTNPKEDRIFQFGCVLIQEGQIVGRFATDINPDRPISKQIQQLTQVTNQKVKHAPYFEDVAETIYHLLSDTIFVAHNIHFDYRFLSAELKRCGLPELTLKGIDTVELAQIFLPTEVSFRLGDLAESLQFTHDMPHQADSDAEVTAKLFLLIEEKMRQLPLITMEAIKRCAKNLSMHTDLFIDTIYHEMKEHLQPLPEQIQVVGQLALVKPEKEWYEAPTYQRSYPKTKAQKTEWLDARFTYRKTQQVLMDQVFDHFSTDEGSKNCFIEAETGSGKTVGYLFPSSFLATIENPLIISTASILLQHQLLYRDIPQLNGIGAYPLQAVVVKSHRHYLDLERFQQTLVETTEMKQYALYQMMILVWLTQTTTGDLDELNLLRLDHLFFTQVAHRGIESVTKHSPFYEVDFLRLLYQRVGQSNVIIVNHAFLAHDLKRDVPLLPSSRYLLIDEAHHLPSALERVATRSFTVTLLSQMMESFVQSIWPKACQEKLPLFFKILEQLDKTSTQLSEWMKDLLPEHVCEWVMESSVRKDFPIVIERLIQRIAQTFKDALVVKEQLAESLVLEKSLHSGEIIEYFTQLEENYEAFCDFFIREDLFLIHRVIWRKQKQQIRFETIDLTASKLAKQQVGTRYQRILYLGATLTTQDRLRYVPEQLGFDQAVLRLPTQFDYQKQAKLFTVVEPIEKERTQQLIAQLRNIMHHYSRSILVLFTSHEQLQAVYQALHFEFFQAGREILAQGIGGSRQKLLKRFTQSDQAILFGADSFWEGVDLPGDDLHLLIVTNLPFDNPNRPLVKAKYAYLEAQGQNAFQVEALPKAVMKLRQGFGRLIRTTTDKGMMIVLDSRLHTANYGASFIRSLPEGLPNSTGTSDEAIEALEDFFD